MASFHVKNCRPPCSQKVWCKVTLVKFKGNLRKFKGNVRKLKGNLRGISGKIKGEFPGKLRGISRKLRYWEHKGSGAFDNQASLKTRIYKDRVSQLPSIGVRDRSHLKKMLPIAGTELRWRCYFAMRVLRADDHVTSMRIWSRSMLPLHITLTSSGWSMKATSEKRRSEVLKKGR